VALLGEMKTSGLTRGQSSMGFASSFITCTTLRLLASWCLVVSSGAKNWISTSLLVAGPRNVPDRVY
jgi:hypothetical protein